jgi:hypothetical protein
MSLVFQNIDPPSIPLSALRVPPPPPTNAGEVHSTHSPGGEGVGGQFFGRRETKDSPLTVVISTAVAKAMMSLSNLS